MAQWLAGLLDLPWEAMQLMRSGGNIIVPIAAISLCMWFLIVRKLIQLRTVRKERLIFERSMLLPSEQSFEPRRGWLARLVMEFHAQRSHDNENDKKLIDSLLRKKSAELERHVPTILMLASVAPLLGLLGTVTGMISTFDAISRIGTGNPRPLASGISEALITTQCGLAVAIPGLMVGSYLNRRVERFRTRLEGLGLRLCKLYLDEPSNFEITLGEER